MILIAVSLHSEVDGPAQVEESLANCVAFYWIDLLNYQEQVFAKLVHESIHVSQSDRPSSCSQFSSVSLLLHDGSQSLSSRRERVLT